MKEATGATFSIKTVRGSAVVLALVLGTVLMLLVAGDASFTSYRISASTLEWNNLKALGIAEAGVALAMRELSLNSTFATHKVNASTVSWDPVELPNTVSLDDNPTFSLTINATKGKGTYEGTFGDGKFRVRVGTIPFADNTATLNIDESKAYAYIESMGTFNDVVRTVRAIIQKRFPAREFLMYDGDVLSITYGIPNNSRVNIFGDGHLYGHNGLEIGRILLTSHNSVTAGTKQEFQGIELMSSGNGNVFVYSDTKFVFRADDSCYRRVSNKYDLSCEGNRRVPRRERSPRARKWPSRVPRSCSGFRSECS